MLMRRIGICLVGFILSIISFSILIRINGYFADTSQSQIDFMFQTIWRTDYLYNPVVVTIVSLAISLLERSRKKFLLVFIATLPFLLFHLAAGSFSFRALAFSFSYLAIAFVVALLVPNRVTEPRCELLDREKFAR